MKSQKSIARKRLKERNRRKDFLKKKNIRKNNWSTPQKEETVSKIRPVFKDKKIVFSEGHAQYEKYSEEKVMRKGSKEILINGEGILPKSRKYIEAKKK